MLDKDFLLLLQEYIDLRLNVTCNSVAERAESYGLYESKTCEYKPHYESFNESMYDTRTGILPHKELQSFIESNQKQTFKEVLLGFIDRAGVRDSDIYKKAGIDRRHFSKIRSQKGYQVGKNTAISLALALELNRNEVDKLLIAAGYSLSDSDTADLIIQFCLEKKMYDIHDVNQALNYFSMKPLGGVLE